MKNKLNLKRKYFEIEQNKKEEHNTNKIKEKKESDSEVSKRKDEIQHKNEGSFEEFWESEKKEEQGIKNFDENLDINLSILIAQTKNLILKINENVSSKEELDLEFETFQIMNYN